MSEERASSSAGKTKDFEKTLRDERQRTAVRIATFEKQFEGIVAYSEGSPPDDEHDPEGATVGFERAQLASLLSKARSDLVEIEAALTRLATGAFGLCERCGESVPPERLEIRPHARTCAICS